MFTLALTKRVVDVPLATAQVPMNLAESEQREPQGGMPLPLGAPAVQPSQAGSTPAPPGVNHLPQPAPALPLPEAGARFDELTPEERVNIAVYEATNRGVANITTEGYRGDRFLFLEVPSKGQGSGVVIDRQGHIVTNYHVVENADDIQVSLFSGNTYEGKLVGRDKVTDIAVIKINAPVEELFPVAFGNSSRLRVGQKVYAIGNPFALERTLSTGIISSLDRFIPSRFSRRKIHQIIQIDAAINPGNSGGPLLDSHGRMIGINTAIASSTGASVGVGFAIPIDTVARVAPQLIRGGRVIRPDVGIAKVVETEKGLLVATLTPGGPAERAGLKGPRVTRQQKRQGPLVYSYQTVDPASADLIVSVDGRKVKTADDFLAAVDTRRPGEQVVLGIVRDGRDTQVSVVLDAGE
jgi:S1-C subfamily serine protease